MNSVAIRLAAALAPILLLAGCGGATAPQPPLAGASIGGPFQLVNQDGKTIHDSDFTGKYRIFYFGYTFCPDVCPTDLQKIAAAMRSLDASDPAVSAKVVPIFVSVDPERDTPPVIKQYVRAFYPRLVGLTGTPAQIASVAKEYGVFSQKQPSATPGGSYLVQHSSAAYLFGPRGEPIAVLPTDQGAGAVAAEVKRWVK